MIHRRCRLTVQLQRRCLATLANEEKPRISPVGIQHLSLGIQEQLFPGRKSQIGSRKNQRLVKLSHLHLDHNGLLGKKAALNTSIDFPLPKLQGSSMDEHFHRLGVHSSQKYVDLTETLMSIGETLPQIPTNWQFKSGWVRYTNSKPPESVPYPLEDSLVFDVEVMYKMTDYPIIATCVSPKAWYGWVSPFLTKESESMDHLIPMNTHSTEKVIVGHNVPYDRARIKDEYNIKASKAFYLDTMALHVAVSGMCSRQRGTWLNYRKKTKKEKEEKDELSLAKIRDEISDSSQLQALMENPSLDMFETGDSLVKDDPWLQTSSMNSLAHVASFYCKLELDKDVRDMFSLEDMDLIRQDFQAAMKYCASDVYATFKVLCKIYPQFRKVSPHPVSFAALRHIGQSFLPTTRKWDDYIETAERLYQENVKKIELNLHKLCEEAVAMRTDPTKPWENDPWLSQLDWTITPPKLTKKGVPYKSQKLPGYPEWYKQLIVKGQLKLTPKSRVSPLLLKLSWEGQPIYWLDQRGWCFLVDMDKAQDYAKKNYTHITLNEEEIDSIPEPLLNSKSFFKVPHNDGPAMRTTNIMAKSFMSHYEKGTLSSQYALAEDLLQMTISCSYWISSRERIKNQFVVYNDGSNTFNFGTDSKMGIILPQVVSMGTITRRAVEKTWLTASNAKKNRLGSELKSMISAPPGYSFVGADVDSEELWIACLVGDSVFKMHGATAIGWMTLEGTKEEGTDLHSKTAKILGISRNEAKIFNYGRIYGAGVKFAKSLLKSFNPTLGEDQASGIAKNLYMSTKGRQDVLKGKKMWYGGSESIVFNRLEQVAEMDVPRTPVLGAGITSALQKNNLKSNTFLPSRINWTIQSSGVDYLHLLLVSMEYLCEVYGIDARLSLTVHDEIRYLVKTEDKYRAALALQISNLWTRAMFCQQMGIDEVPQSCAFFSAVDIDHVLRKEVDLDCITPSHPHAIPHGESLGITKLLDLEEVRQSIESFRDMDLLDIPYTARKPVLESLDKSLDSVSREMMISLQISQEPKQFKALKKTFLNNQDMIRNKEFELEMRKEKLDSEEVLKGKVVDRVKLNFKEITEVVDKP
ncbi:unnamed protein product [Kuraishia capsulata CBS 1993]|uniref:DNA polymerase gamma n=1 Tax=Kuraishia capsulata CBS 1993 TaxID=1382522 RepID=W6MRR6_9ASCO|nr:uncharacterized protein KUCA_T00005402001 [Kuraishia capsulata CBS 1993]CDK29414.1 unnamed protein product [Kuraishia capsulata CBS 1993]